MSVGDAVGVDDTERVTVDVGDAYIASADNAGGTEASVGASWFVLEHNLVSALTGAIATIAEMFTGTDNTKLLTPATLVALWKQGVDVASAATVTFGDGGYFNVTGTTTITALAFTNDHSGRMVWVKFAGALTLTHNATSLILPTGANIATAAGDTALFVSEGSGNFRCLSYRRADGTALVASSASLSRQAVTSSATVTPAATNDVVDITAQAVGLTLANWSGSPQDGWGMMVRIKDNGSAQTIAFGTKYRAMGTTLPTSTVAGKWMILGMEYNGTDDKYDVTSVINQA